jgi:hypothetical protein
MINESIPDIPIDGGELGGEFIGLGKESFDI